MRALCIERPAEMRLVDIAPPTPEADELLIRVRAAGICGSDLELLRGTRPRDVCRYPIVPGHEWAGEAGGQVVVAESFRACGRCARCREGHTNLCTSGYAETGFTHQGAFAEYVCVPERLIHRLPPGTDYAAAALLEPAACVAEGVMQVDLRPGMSIAVVGAGTLGLLAAAMVSDADPARLAVVGGHPKRLALAARLGATETHERPSVGLRSQFDLVFEATSRPGGAQTAIDLARRGGTVVLEGINGSDRPSVLSDDFSLKQLRAQGVFGASTRAWQWAIDWMTKRDPGLELLVTHRFALEDFTAAFAILEDRSAGAVKVQLNP